MPDQIKFANYVVERLKQIGVKQIFGVPGDYNLEFLDFFEKDPVLQWVGNANELNAAYAADGYARVKGSLAVLVTTFGVGELSALNGIAGSLSERVPVLHIVGAPSTKQQADHALLHHTLNLPSSFGAFARMSAPLSCASALLNEVKVDSDHSLTDALDAALKHCLVECRPAYVELPMDIVHSLVSAAGLKKPLPEPSAAPPFAQLRRHLKNSTDAPTSSLIKLDNDQFDRPTEGPTAYVVKAITEMFANAKRPIVLVDACAVRFGMKPIVRDLVEKCSIRCFTTPMGKSVLDERSPFFGGCYAGANSLTPVKEEVESADFVLYVGSLKSDFNSGSFSVKIPVENTVRLHSFTTYIGYASFPTTDIREVLPRLVPAFDGVVRALGPPDALRETLEEKMKANRVMTFVDEPTGETITQEWLWPRVGAWFKDNDIIVTETGTSSFGLIPAAMPSHATYVTQVLWGSIGWSVGATLGCALAAEEEEAKRRTVLFVGDGSLQLTVQEIGTMVRRGVKPYIFVLNNDGYEIERQIHGPNADYNNIQPYDHQLLLPFLGGRRPNTPYESHVCGTQAELQALLADKAFNVPDRIRLIELVMPKHDAPECLIIQAKLTAEANSA